ncbi:MAG: glycerophosphodiester phosphodiesterase [Gemmatimonadota bacterium]|nr:glycerophosphodiester phosphodiesterase [Gemmatimonadota bacterium]
MLLLELGARPVIAHRGSPAQRPENTLASFHRAVELGADALELDVHLSADGIAVVIHDRTLDRTTDRSGPVAAHPLASLRQADAGARFTTDGGRTHPWAGRGVQIPTLDEILESFPHISLVIEIKCRGAQHAVRQALQRHAAEGRCLLASYDSAALTVFDSPRFLSGGSRADALRLLLTTTLRRPAAAIRPRALFLPTHYGGVPILTRRLVDEARAQGVPVHAWTVDDPAYAARLWRKGVCGIVSNQADAMLTARGIAPPCH